MTLEVVGYSETTRRITAAAITDRTRDKHMALWRVDTALKSRSSYHVFITSAPFFKSLLTLRQPLRYSHLSENKLAEACASRTHRRHQGCRPPVLKTGRITGSHALPRQRPTMFPVTRAGNQSGLPAMRLLRLSNYAQVRLQGFETGRVFLFGLLVVDGRGNDHVIARFPVHRCGDIVLRCEL